MLMLEQMLADLPRGLFFFISGAERRILSHLDSPVYSHQYTVLDKNGQGMRKNSRYKYIEQTKGTEMINKAQVIEMAN